MTTKNLYMYEYETLKFRVQINDEQDNPIDTNNFTVECAVGVDFGGNNTLLSTSNNEQISIIDANSAIYEVVYNPSSNVDYDWRDQMYQVRTINSNTNHIDIVLDGRIFVEPSMFKSS